MPKKNFGILKSEFQNLDTNATGSVSTDDFRRCLSIGEMKATTNLVDYLINELDDQKTGVISYEVFLNYCFLSQIILKDVNLRQ